MSVETRPLPARINLIVEALRPYEPQCVILFGSWGNGEADTMSDVDLVVIRRSKVPFLERLQEVARLLPAEAGSVDVLVYTPDEFSAMRRDGNAFAEMIAEEGLLIYGRYPEV